MTTGGRERVMAARKPKLTQYKIRGQFGARGIEQAVFFLWAKSEKQARRTVQEVAPRVGVTEVKALGALVADPGHATEHATGAPVGRAPVAPRFFADRRP
jgi:hypothetical protein